jgi:hypothetical protein
MSYLFGQVVLYATMIAVTPQQAAMPNNTKSEAEYVSEIHSLTSRTDALSESIARWNKWNTFFVGFTVIAALGLFVTQRTVNGKTDHLVGLENSLGDAKDNLAALKLAGVDGANTQLRTDLENAKTESRNADSRLAGEQRKTADAQTKLAEEQRKTADAQAKLEGEQQKTAKAQEDAARAQLKVNQTLTSFARRSGDRVLNEAAFVDGIKDLPKRTVEVWFKGDDTEAQMFAYDIVRALQSAKWMVSARPLNTGELLDGIPLTTTRGMMVFSSVPGDVLGLGNTFMSKLLESIHFGAAAIGSPSPTLPANTIVIVIGERQKA